jgi:putative SOS response-associated peptidase YedK
MCGRFTLRKSAEELAAYFHTHGIPTWSRRYNIAPEQHVLTLFEGEHGEREWALRRWGLVPSWSKEPKVSFSNINARVENVTKSPAFRGAFKHRRCLIPADRFYEWSGPKGHKVATLFHLKDDGLFAFAGLWEHWERDAEVLDTCALITTGANEVVKPVHGRMPIMLLHADFAPWLDSAELPEPFPIEKLAAVAVGSKVNNPRNDGPECIKPTPSA